MKKDLNETKVYVYCDPRYSNNGKGYKYKFKGESLKLKYKPFYIGCAGYNNYSRHLAGNKSSELVQRRIKKIRENKAEPIVKILRAYENKKKAQELEKILIIEIGRQDLKTGPLLNKADGYGNRSLKGNKKASEKMKNKWQDFEYRKDISEKRRKKWKDFEFIKKMKKVYKEAWKNPERKKKAANDIRKRNLKNWKDPKYRKKMIKVMKNRSKLVKEEVLEIRKLYQEGIGTYAEIGEIFNVSTSTIARIIHRQSWTHI